MLQTQTLQMPSDGRMRVRLGSATLAVRRCDRREGVSPQRRGQTIWSFTRILGAGLVLALALALCVNVKW